MPKKWVSLFLLIVFVLPMVGSCNSTSSASFNGYTFTTPSAAISFAVAGVANDGSQSAGADPAAMITPNGLVRLIFTGANGNMKSATSADGTTFTMDSSFASPFPLVGMAEQTIVANPSGGFRMFARQDGKVYSATSTDGAVWTMESGIRFDVTSMGLTTITGPSVVRLSNGQYRMYFSPEPTNCATAGTTAAIYSATSTDQLTWTADSGERIGEAVDSRCKNKPVAIVESDGSVTLFYHVYSRTGSGDSYSGMIFYSNSTDGLTFSTQTSTGFGVVSPTSAGLTMASDPAILKMADGTMRLYFDVFYAPNGDQIYVSSGTKN